MKRALHWVVGVIALLGEAFIMLAEDDLDA